MWNVSIVALNGWNLCACGGTVASRFTSIRAQKEREKKWKRPETKSNWRFRGIFFSRKRTREIIAGWLAVFIYYFIFILMGLWTARRAGFEIHGEASIDRNKRKKSISFFFLLFCLLLCGDCVCVFIWIKLMVSLLNVDNGLEEPSEGHTIDLLLCRQFDGILQYFFIFFIFSERSLLSPLFEIRTQVVHRSRGNGRRYIEFSDSQ